MQRQRPVGVSRRAAVWRVCVVGVRDGGGGRGREAGGGRRRRVERGGGRAGAGRGGGRAPHAVGDEGVARGGAVGGGAVTAAAAAVGVHRRRLVRPTHVVVVDEERVEPEVEHLLREWNVTVMSQRAEHTPVRTGYVLDET